MTPIMLIKEKREARAALRECLEDMRLLSEVSSVSRPQHPFMLAYQVAKDRAVEAANRYAELFDDGG